MGTDLAARLTPYISYIFFGQLVVTGLAILVACLLVLRRMAKRDPLASVEPDKERIAKEIHQEILRLRALRDSLMPGREDEADIAPVPRPVSEGPAVTTEATAPVAGPASPVELEAAEKRGELRGEEKMKALVADLEAKLAAAASASASPAPAEGGASSEELEKAKKAASEAEAQTEALKEKVGALEKVLAEYQIFEEDFALVKKYKEENDRLRQQLEAGGGAGPGPKVTEDDIASLFSDFDGLAPLAENRSPAVAPVAAKALEAHSEPEPAAESEDSSFAELEAALATEGDSDPAPEPVPLPKAQEPAPAAAPALSLNEETAEALAESTGTDDELMAEFEKLLGGETKS
jgi:hypothetical protein